MQALFKLLNITSNDIEMRKLQADSEMPLIFI